jgi:hypothetical protein
VSATLVDAQQLLDVMLTAVAAGVGVPVLFSVAVLAATRTAEHRRERSRSALGYGMLTAASLALCVAAVAFGVVLLTRK